MVKKALLGKTEIYLARKDTWDKNATEQESLCVGQAVLTYSKKFGKFLDKGIVIKSEPDIRRYTIELQNTNFHSLLITVL